MACQVTSAVIELLRAEAGRAHPAECCGILLGRGRAITRALPAANVHHDPLSHFEIDPQALIDAHRAARSGGPQVLGYYHSHPHGPAQPSVIDRSHAAHDGAIWAIVAGLNDVTFWQDGEDGFAPLSYTLAEV